MAKKNLPLGAGTGRRLTVRDVKIVEDAPEDAVIEDPRKPVTGRHIRRQKNKMVNKSVRRMEALFAAASGTETKVSMTKGLEERAEATVNRKYRKRKKVEESS